VTQTKIKTKRKGPIHNIGGGGEGRGRESAFPFSLKKGEGEKKGKRGCLRGEQGGERKEKKREGKK